MQFRVVIPEHVKAGQTIRIHCPDGTEANVKVPKGMKTGDSFIFEMAVDQLNNPEALLETIKKEQYHSNAQKGFLDREILNAQDFLLACCVGLIIGMGIVLGFFLGILYATHGYVPEEPTNPLQQQQQQQYVLPGSGERVMTNGMPIQ